MVIETLNPENPFSDYGKIVYGVRFIGRKYAIDKICNRVLGYNYGNLAIIGLPRIGKSSLVWNTVMTKKNELEKNNTIPIWMWMGSVKSSFDFYTTLLSMVLDQLRNKNENLYSRLNEEKILYQENRYSGEIIQFFSILYQESYKVIVILDEFDNASNIFEFADFQLCLALSTMPDYKLCFITISRRTIPEIELRSGGTSQFYGSLEDLRLGVFNDADILEYWNRINHLRVDVSNEHKAFIKHLVGNHPFLMDMVNSYCFNSLKSGQNILSDNTYNLIENELRLRLYESFNSALKILNEEQLESKTFQIVYGPMYDANSIDEQKLLKYEFIKEVSKEEKQRILGNDFGLINRNNMSYVCFSNYCTEYFMTKRREINYWPIWEKTEISLRNLIKKYLDDSFTGDWIPLFKAKVNSETRNKKIDLLMLERDKYVRNFPDRASDNIIDYTYPRDIYDIFISADWHWFGKVFGEGNIEKSKWANIFNFLSKIRNPIAHNNSEFIPIEDIEKAKSFCDEILDKIKKYGEIN